MKKITFLLALSISFLCHADRDNGIIEATARKNISFDLEKLDQVGSSIENSKSGVILLNHCQTRKETGVCSEIIHIIKLNEKNLVLHDAKYQLINQNVDSLERKLAGGFIDSMNKFKDYDMKYSRDPGDFTGTIGSLCIYNPRSCALLLLLPVTISADLLMLPIDLSIHYGQRYSTRKKAQFFMKSLNQPEDTIELKNRAFLKLLKGLAQF